VGHKTNTFSTHFSLKMVSTRSKAGVNKQADAGPSGPAGITPDLAAILDDQVKMQQVLADLRKRNADEIEALRQENSRLRRIQSHPSHLHHHPTNTHPFHPSPYRSPNPCRYPPYHSDPLQHTHHPTHHTCSTIQPAIPSNKPHPPP